MALVPAANGVDALVAGYGVSATDIGNNRFEVALNVVNPAINLAVAIPAVIPAGPSEAVLNPDGPIQSPVSGAHIFEVLLSAGINGEPVVFGPNDRISLAITVTDGDQEVTQNNTTIPMISQAGNPNGYVSSAVIISQYEAGTQYNYYVQLLNASGTMSLGEGAISIAGYPLTANQQPLPDVGLMRAGVARPRIPFHRR